MLVEYWMSRDVYTISPETPILDAERIMHERGFRRLPVVKRGRLVGIVTLSDIRGAKPSPATSLSIWELNYLVARITVGEIMTKDVITISPKATIEEAASIMRERKVGALPVVEEGKLVGIITESDLLDAFMEIMGVGKGGVRLVLELEDRPGALAEALEPLKEHGVNVVSVCTCHRTKAGPMREVVVRLRGDRADEAARWLSEKGLKVLEVRRERG